jgi:para-nitrobenzyl esterase
VSRNLLLALLSLFALFLAVWQQAPPLTVHLDAQTATCRVPTSNGEVQGARRGGACTYFSIPYAAAPIGNLRWRPPQPAARWAPAILDATTARQCAQLNLNTGAVQGIEDCLLLHIWAPATPSPTGRPWPVLLWLHPGAFQAANAAQPASDGARFAETREAIVVAPNYRLGSLGMLRHSALTAEDRNYPTSGNYTLADQRAALRWIHEHIGAFGGDSSNITLSGTSAGAESASLHLVSPATRGLFHRAILQSGSASFRWTMAGEADVLGDRFAAALGCTNPTAVLTCLRNATVDQILRAIPLGQSQILEDGRFEWRPNVDGVEIPDQPRELYRQGRFSRVPLIVGTNGDEGWFFVDRSFSGGIDTLQYERTIRTEFGMDAESVLRLYPSASFPTPKDALARVVGDAEFVCEARRLARAAHRDGAPVYVYSFEYGVSNVAAGRSVHGLEPHFVFGNNFAVAPNLGITTPFALTSADEAIFDAMSTYWRRFMESGDPNPRGQRVQWPAYRPGQFDEPVDASRSDRHFVFGSRLGVANYLRDQQCNFWEGFNFRSTIGPVPAAAR